MATQSFRLEQPSATQEGERAATPFHDEVYTRPPERVATTDGGAERDRGSAGTPVERAQWTVAINLAANGTFDGDANGAANQWRRLRELADQSRGSSVNLVVQVADGNSSTKGGGAPGANTTVTRYLISNGEVRELSQGRSRGLAGDAADLLRTANEVAPAEHIGFIQQSHGGSTEGLEGAAGKATLTEFADAIREGLAGSGHQRLDLIDFNACSMGSATVMSQMSRVADHMVASAEQEFSDKNGTFDAQNMQTELGRLMRNSSWTPAQLAADMISQADAGANDGINSTTGELDTGTRTLAHYDLTRNAEFTAAMDTFGDALANAVRGNRDNLAAVDRSIDSAPVLPREGMSMAGRPNEERDLSTFARNLVGEIDAGRFTDSDGSVRRAAEGLLAAQRVVEPEYHGTTRGGYDQLGGLNAFLPDLQLRDSSRDAGNENRLPGVVQQSDPTNEYTANFAHKATAVENITADLTRLSALLGDSHADDMSALRANLDAVRDAGDAASYRAAMTALHTRATELQSGAFGRDANAAAHRRIRDEYFTRESLADAPGWQRFMEVLRTSEDH